MILNHILAHSIVLCQDNQECFLATGTIPNTRATHLSPVLGIKNKINGKSKRNARPLGTGVTSACLISGPVF